MWSVLLMLAEKPIAHNMPQMLADPRVRIEIGYTRLVGNQPAEDEFPGLRPAQKHRIFQMAIQRMGWNALTHSEMVARLGLSAKEVDSLRDVITPKAVAPRVDEFVRQAGVRLVRCPQILGPHRWKLLQSLRGRPVEGIFAEDLPLETLGIPVTGLNDEQILRSLGVTKATISQWRDRRRRFPSEAEFLEAFRVTLSASQQTRARQLILQARGPESILQATIAWDLQIRNEDRADLFAKMIRDNADFLKTGPVPKPPVYKEGERDAHGKWITYGAAMRKTMERYHAQRRSRIWSWLSPNAKAKYERAIGKIDPWVTRGPSKPVW
jgi:hypothetical protein